MVLSRRLRTVTTVFNNNNNNNNKSIGNCTKGLFFSTSSTNFNQSHNDYKQQQQQKQQPHVLKNEETKFGFCFSDPILKNNGSENEKQSIDKNTLFLTFVRFYSTRKSSSGGKKSHHFANRLLEAEESDLLENEEGEGETDNRIFLKKSLSSSSSNTTSFNVYSNSNLYPMSNSSVLNKYKKSPPSSSSSSSSSNLSVVSALKAKTPEEELKEKKERERISREYKEQALESREKYDRIIKRSMFHLNNLTSSMPVPEADLVRAKRMLQIASSDRKHLSRALKCAVEELRLKLFQVSKLEALLQENKIPYDLSNYQFEGLPYHVHISKLQSFTGIEELEQFIPNDIKTDDLR